MQGKIIKNISNDYTVLADNKEYICKCRGKFRKLKLIPFVGDKVIIDEKNNYIIELLPRKNELIRPPICNVDQAFVITSVKEPDFSSNLLDKLLNIIEFNNIKPIICFTKLDLLDEQEKEKIKKIMDYYKKIGYIVLINNEIKKINELFKDKITVFTGQSGAGKSTLLNKLNKDLNIKTAPISHSLGRGKHTTRHTELINMKDGYVADTPGFSSIDFTSMTKEQIRDNFIEFNEFKENCKYRDCMHHKEDDCEIKRKVKEGIILKTRYENYLKFIEEKLG